MLSCGFTMKAQTLHTLIFCDTNDRSIGPNKESERNITINEMQTIAEVLDEYGYDHDLIECHGDYCNKRNLMQVVRGLDIGPQDVVFFYYGGHGSRAMNNSNDPFPQMCLGEDYQENWVPATLIKNMIMNKNPRLAVIITGCCNKEDAGVTIKSVMSEARYTKESNINKEAYRKLFLDSKGYVMMTSSKAGQFSYSGREGGVFCLNFWPIMNKVGEGNLSADWETVCSEVKRVVSQVPIPTRDGTVYQEPYYSVVVNGQKNTVNPNRNTNNTVTINNQNSTLSEDINKLLNKDISTDQRLRMMSAVMTRHFATGAKVMTVGRNMTTLVDYEDVEVFLRRIILSPYIKQINIISEEGSGKKTQIKVHEVRTN